MQHKFPEKRLFVTGAGSGLGRDLVLRFASAGWRIAVSDIDANRAAATFEQASTLGADGFHARVDVRAETDLRDVRERLERAWSGVDVVINNAGVSSAGTVADTPLEDWHWMIDINLMGVVRGCHEFAPLLARQRGGHIVNIASFAGIAQAPAMAAYNVAKIGVIGLSESLRAELRPFGVGVSVACPAFFQTNLMESFRTPDPQLREMANKLIASSSVSAADVADDIYHAVIGGQFMVISHSYARWLWRLKRLAPGWYFRLLDKRSWRYKAAVKQD